MDIRSLTFGRLVMGGWSLVGRQDWIFGRKHHGGALVIWPLRMLREILALSTNVEFPRRKKTFFVKSSDDLPYLPYKVGTYGMLV
jgi:hypothetical protein